ncbi:MAG: DNA polymerase I [Planctomycetes bacterium]|nr:DNA polymerase I [Planctomycetota bacterium]
MPEDLVEQIPYLRLLTEALGIPFILVPGFEADDLIGTLARRAEARGLSCMLVTADKDFMQLVTGAVSVYRPRRGEPAEVIGPAGVEEAWGVPPARIADLLGLMGDSSDNIPGVEGVGRVTAARLLREHGDLEGVLGAAAGGTMKASKTRERLVEHAEVARLSRSLATIDVEAAVELDLGALRVAPPSLDRLLPLLRELEFHSLLDRYTREAARADVAGEPAVSPYAAVVQDYKVLTDAAEVAAYVERLRRLGELAFDTETTGLDPLTARLVGVSLSGAEGEARYIPANVPGGEGLIREQVAPLLGDPSVPKGAQNASYDLQVLAAHGIRVRGLAFDTMVADHLVDPTVRHGLDLMSLRYLGYTKIKTEELIGKGKDQITMDRVEVARVGRYACEDADFTWRLHRLLGPRVAELGLEAWYREVEVPLVEVLASMERTGVRVDADRLREQSGTMTVRLAALEAQIHELAGEVFNVASPRQLGPVLFERLRVQDSCGVRRVPRTKTGWSTDAGVLEPMSGVPIVARVLEHRELAKLKGTYLDALPGLVNPVSGRIHTSYHQTGTATGRVSSSDPNLQNIPVRTPVGREVRRAFVPRGEGWGLLSADYSQIELRLMAHMAAEPYLIDAFRRGEDIHASTAALVFGVPPAQVDPVLRGRAKAINFGLLYGMGPQRLARETGLGLDEARRFIDDYFTRLPRVRDYIARSIEEVRLRGYATTLAGRRRSIPEIHQANRGLQVNAENMAVNTPVQGSAADVIKRAMVAIHRRLAAEGWQAAMLLQVHDELVFECPEGEREALTAMVREEMAGAWRLAVPLVVDVGWGASWAEAH